LRCNNGAGLYDPAGSKSNLFSAGRKKNFRLRICSAEKTAKAPETGQKPLSRSKLQILGNEKDYSRFLEKNKGQKPPIEKRGKNKG